MGPQGPIAISSCQFAFKAEAVDSASKLKNTYNPLESKGFLCATVLVGANPFSPQTPRIRHNNAKLHFGR